jgi:IS30 family transposase
MARERRIRLRKLARFSHMGQSVIERIQHGWSPDQIAGRMRLEHHPISVSHETIYKFAYSVDGQAIKLWRHLPEHRARRRPRHARRRHGQRFSPELNILRRRAKAVRTLGVRSHPVPSEVRQGECDIACREGQPVRRSPAQ